MIKGRYESSRLKISLAGRFRLNRVNFMDLNLTLTSSEVSLENSDFIQSSLYVNQFNKVGFIFRNYKNISIYTKYLVYLILN